MKVDCHKIWGSHAVFTVLSEQFDCTLPYCEKMTDEAAETCFQTSNSIDIHIDFILSSWLIMWFLARIIRPDTAVRQLRGGHELTVTLEQKRRQLKKVDGHHSQKNKKKKKKKKERKCNHTSDLIQTHISAHTREQESTWTLRGAAKGSKWRKGVQREGEKKRTKKKRGRAKRKV